MHDLPDIANWLQQRPHDHDGRLGVGALVSFCSDDYLALTRHPALLAAAQQALAQHGLGDASARWPDVGPELYRVLQARLATLTQRPDAVLFNSGYMANLGALSALVKASALARLHGYRGRKRHQYAFYADECNHLSTREGIQMSGALRYHYRHAEIDHLEALLKAGADEGSAPIIVSDGVFGIDGSIAPLPALVALAERYGALLYLNDAEAIGVLGAQGAGTSEHYGCASPLIVQAGSLSAALGGLGGFVAAERDVVEVIRLSSAAYGYSSPPPPASAAALLAALDVLAQAPQRRARLWQNQRYFVAQMAPLGYTLLSSQTPVVPVLIGAAETCQHYVSALRKEGIAVDALQFPAAPVGQARLCFRINAEHSAEQIDRAVRVMAQLAGRASRV